MRANQQCPKCRCRKFLVVDEVQQPMPTYANDRLQWDAAPMGVTTKQLEVKKQLLGLMKTRQTEPAGRFEAWVCAACGLTEWYAKDLWELAELADANGSGVRLVDADAGPSPFR
jgi:predicted nucleic-acid-binding Zn-ribbon protein